MIRAIIFDYFDVFRTDGYNRWLQQHGYARSGPFLAASEGHDKGTLSDKEFFQAIADASGESAEQVEHEMEADVVVDWSLVDYLATLRGTYKTALLSNSSSEYLRNELKQHELEKYFDVIVISSEVGLIKPEPEVFEYIMQKLRVRPEECIFTDDNQRHIAAAEKLGIKSILFTGVSELKQQIERITGGR